MPISPFPPHTRRGIRPIALLSIASATACVTPAATRAHIAQPAAESPARAEPRAPAASYDSFGFALLARLAAASPERNVVISPAGAGIALAMALEGAAGDTRDSLAAVLGFGDDPGEVTRQNAALLGALRDTSDVTLTVANALWGRTEVPFDPAFMSRVREGYGAEVAALDLSSQSAVERINAWASANTRGMITGIISRPLPREAALLLTNAIYFKGRWDVAFEPEATTPHPFRREDGTSVTQPMMARRGDFGYYAGDGFRLARLPYRGGELSMYIVLPDSNQKLDTIDTRLGAEQFRAAVAAASTTTRDLVLLLPRFKLECTASLTKPIEALGAANAFDPNRADFTRLIVPRGDEPRRTWLGNALQRSFIEVNEEGTEAAAVTGVVVMTVTGISSSRPEQFTVDRPFLFAIRHDPTGALLFVGQIADPSGECGSRE
jgi:serpin B